MKRGLALLLGWAVFCLPLHAQQPALPAWNTATQQGWWSQYPTPDKWPQAIDQLKGMLADRYKHDGSSAFSSPDFRGWLDHLEWIQLGLDCPDVLANEDNFKTFVTLAKDEAVSHLFVEKLDPHDIKKMALQNIIRLAQANLGDLNEYAALGVAYSLVFDQAFPRTWPHAQVPQAAVPMGDLDVVKRFAFYVQANRDKKLEQDLTQLTFENLKFMVDTEVSLSELAYAQTDHTSYSRFEEAFFNIHYDESRAQGGNYVFTWNSPTYKLKDIATNGGICVDQAYYASTLGKGRGIPTLYFHGEGTGGGHAWFGYMSRSGKWELDCGRYESQNYPKGFALDPQTWEQIDDTVLTNFFKNGTSNPNYPAAKTALAWASINPSNRQIFDDARTIMPELTEAWEREADALNAQKASVDERKAFYQSWITQFQPFPTMKIEGQRRLLALLRETNDPGADDLQRSIVLQNRGEGFDQGIQGAADAISGKVDAGDWDGARLEFEKTIRDFGEQGGGTLYYQVIVPYVQSCLQKGHVDLAEKALTFIDDRMQIEPESIIGEQLRGLKSMVEEQKQKSPAASGP